MNAFRKRIILFVTSISYVLSVDFQTQQEIAQKSVFTSFQTIEVSLKTICGSSILNNIITMKSPQENMFIALSDTCGIVISRLNQDGTYQQLKSYPQDSEITQMVIQFSHNTLWVADMSKNVNIYDISNPLNFVKLNTIQGSTPTVFLNFSNDGTQVFLIQGGGLIQIYNIENGQIVFLQQFINAGNPQMIVVSQNNKVMIVAAFNIFFYPITSTYNSKQPYVLSSNYMLDNEDDTLGVYIVDNRYLFSCLQRSGLAQFDILQCLLTGICDKTTIIPLYSQKALGYVLGFSILTADSNYFVTFLNSFGIYVFDISDRQGFLLFQKIDFQGISSSMALTSNEQQILMSKDGNLNVFQRIQSNLNLDAPNIMNLNQNYLFNSYMNSNTWSWHCGVENNILIITYNSNGVYFFDIQPVNKSLKLINKISLNLPNSLDEYRILNDRNYIVASYGVGGLYFYKQQNNYQQLDQVSQYIPPMPNADMDCVRQTQDGNTLFIASGYAGIIVVDISNILQPKHITSVYYTYEKNQITSAENVFIGKDDKVLYAAYRYFGVVIYDVSDITKPVQKNVLFTLGGEDMTATSDGKHLVVCDGYKGLTIYDIEQDPFNPVYLNSVQTSGWTVHMKFIQQDNYILVTTQQRGQLFVVDFRDRQNPKLLSGFQNKGIDNVAFDVCYTPDESTSFIVTPKGIAVIPLRSTLVFHTDIIWLQDIPNSSLKKLILMNPSSDLSQSDGILLVGMNAQLQLSQIYANNAVILKDAFYYDNYELKTLPWWIMLSQNSLSVTLTVSKDALDQQEIQDQVNAQDANSSAKVIIPKQKQIVFLLSERVTSNDFIENSVPITPDLSLQIYSDCLKQQIINEAGFLNENVGLSYLNEILKQSNYNSDVIEHMKYILRSKLTYYPVAFTIANSLYIDILNNSNLVDSFSSTLSVYFYSQSNQARFINMNYPGVLTSFTDKQDQVKIEGDINAVNKVLIDGIKIANLTQVEMINITMEVDDGVNYNLQKTFILSDSRIMSLNLPTYVNPALSLQQDFSKTFQNSEIAILDKFQYQVSSQIFLDDDSPVLQVQALILSSNGTFVAFSNNFWLTFDSNQKVFSGSPPSNLWKTSLQIKIIASDGYTKAEDILNIHINNVPIQVIITLFFQIIGPLIGLLGLWKYSNIIYNIYSKNKHDTTCIIVYTREIFQLQIPLIKEELRLARQLWIQYFDSISKDELLLQINHFKKKFQEKVQIEFILNSEKSSVQDSQFQIEKSIIKGSAFITTQQPTNKKDNNTSNQQLMKLSSTRTFNYEQRLQHNNRNEDMLKKENESERQTSHPNQDSILEPKHFEKESSSQKKVIKQVRYLEKKQMQRARTLTQKQQNINDYHQNCFFCEDGGLNNAYLINEVKQFYIMKNKTFQNETILKELSSPQSKISRCILGLASIQFAKFDQSSFKIIEYLRQQALKFFTPQDWYKHYVRILPDFSSVLNQPFPMISINEEILFQELTVFNSIQDANLAQNINSEPKIIYYLPLVKECLISIAYGFIFESHLWIPQPRGECLEMDSQSLKSIDSYTPATSKTLTSIRKYFDLEFVQKELSENSRLNSWIQKVDVLNNVILIQGTPQNQDAGIYLLKIRDQNGYTIKRIRIQILQNHSQQEKDSTNNLISQKFELPTTTQEVNEENQLIKHNNGVATELENSLVRSVNLPRYTIHAHKNSLNSKTIDQYCLKEDELLL